MRGWIGRRSGITRPTFMRRVLPSISERVRWTSSGVRPRMADHPSRRSEADMRLLMTTFAFLLVLKAPTLLADDAVAKLLEGNFRWKSTPALVKPVERPEDPCISIKDPTVVYHDGKWHLFCTIRSKQ